MAAMFYSPDDDMTHCVGLNTGFPVVSAVFRGGRPLYLLPNWVLIVVEISIQAAKSGPLRVFDVVFTPIPCPAPCLFSPDTCWQKPIPFDSVARV